MSTEGSLILLALMFALGWFVLDSARAREIAVEVCRETCRRRSFQLLDETVALRGIRLIRTERGVRLRRLYRFEFSDDGVSRRPGSIAMIGADVDHFILASSRSEDSPS